MWSQVLFEFYLCAVTTYTIQVFKKISNRNYNKQLFVAIVPSNDLEFNAVADLGFPRFWSETLLFSKVFSSLAPPPPGSANVI